MGTRVAIVDDHPMLRLGLKNMLAGSSDISVVAEASSGYEALAILMKARPDLVLLDVVLPDIDGIQVLRELRRRLPDMKVVILSALDNQLTVGEAFANRADGYIPKQVTRDELVSAIDTVMSGETYIHPSLGELGQSHGLLVGTLTARQRQVLKRVATGASNKEIAEELEITPETVKSHVGEILRRLGCRDRTAAVAKAIKDKLI